MSMITLDAEFLRRALVSGVEESSVSMEVLPDGLPADFPVHLPPALSVRVLGSVRSVAARWVISDSFTPQLPAEPVSWRVFLDSPGSQQQVMAAFIAALTAQEWQTPRHGWGQAFVEATRADWTGVHLSQLRTLNLFTRTEGDVVQVWLTVQDSNEQQVDHMLNQQPNMPLPQLMPLPALAAPEGWGVQTMQGGGGGEERSERALLFSPLGAQVDLPVLLAHFQAQLEAQDWIIQFGQGTDLFASTPLGLGLLTVTAHPQGAEAFVWQMARNDSGRVTASYTLHS
jgi:hypothetical protein